MTNYTTENLIGGKIETQQVPFSAGTYYRGMPLQYNFTVPTTGVADAGNTGSGTVTSVSQGPTRKLKIGDYELECEESVTNGGIFSLSDPTGTKIATNLIIYAGSGEATEFSIGGLIFTVTDGSTDFAEGDFFTISVSAGNYGYLEDGDIAGIFLGEEKILSDNDYNSIIIGGEIMEGGIVDSSNSAYTITEDVISNWASFGFYIKK